MDLELDSGNSGTEKDLEEIAHQMLDWEVKLSAHLGLTEVNLADIKHDYKKAEEQKQKKL